MLSATNADNEIVNSACSKIHDNLPGFWRNVIPLSDCMCPNTSIIEVFTQSDGALRKEIRRAYKTIYGRRLPNEIVNALSGYYKEAVVGLCYEPREYDAYQIRDALTACCTDHRCLIQIFASRTNEEMSEITEFYNKKFNTDLMDDVSDKTGGDLGRLLFSLANADREDEESPIDQIIVEEDLKRLYNDGDGPDVITFHAVFCRRSMAHLKVVFEDYHKSFSMTIEDMIDENASGGFRDGLMAISQCVDSRTRYFSGVLHRSMNGLGTDERTLTRTLISRSEIDLQSIRALFDSTYNDTLFNYIRDDTSGNYRRLLLRLLDAKTAEADGY
ncbi:annexin A4-like [Tubulanus polymorphus]|uniref:annexin A4-like n=1 Tax=Tubulanus polymorphus TaxID=672921 RepID=UPI003DA37A82